MLMHDLKIPLSLIGGYIARLMSEKAGPVNKKQRQYFEIIWGELRRMEYIINTYQDKPIQEGMHPKGSTDGFDLKASLRELCELFTDMAEERNISLSIMVPDGLSSLKGCSKKLYRVFANLLKNALTYTPRGGRVDIRVKEEELYIISEIRDSGIGVRTDELRNVFSLFYRSQDVTEKAGSGLGLAIVKSIVESHGGKVWVESEYGKGSSFFVQLPKMQYCK